MQSFVESKEIISANAEISTALKEKHGVKHGLYAKYNKVLSSKIEQRATMNKISASLKHFTSKLSWQMNESTTHSIKKQYIKLSKANF